MMSARCCSAIDVDHDLDGVLCSRCRPTFSLVVAVAVAVAVAVCDTTERRRAAAVARASRLHPTSFSYSAWNATVSPNLRRHSRR